MESKPLLVEIENLKALLTKERDEKKKLSDRVGGLEGIVVKLLSLELEKDATIKALRESVDALALELENKLKVGETLKIGLETEMFEEDKV